MSPFRHDARRYMACALPLFQTQPYESSFTLPRGPNAGTALAIRCRIAISPHNQAGARLAGGLNPLKDTDGMLISLPPDYRPSDDEEFMNPMQTEYFRQKLLRWRGELVKEANGTLASLGE